MNNNRDLFKKLNLYLGQHKTFNKPTRKSYLWNLYSGFGDEFVRVYENKCISQQIAISQFCSVYVIKYINVHEDGKLEVYGWNIVGYNVLHSYILYFIHATKMGSNALDRDKHAKDFKEGLYFEALIKRFTENFPEPLDPKYGLLGNEQFLLLKRTAYEDAAKCNSLFMREETIKKDEAKADSDLKLNERDITNKTLEALNDRENGFKWRCFDTKRKICHAEKNKAVKDMQAKHEKELAALEKTYDNRSDGIEEEVTQFLELIVPDLKSLKYSNNLIKNEKEIIEKRKDELYNIKQNENYFLVAGINCRKYRKMNVLPTDSVMDILNDNRPLIAAMILENLKRRENETKN